MREPQVQVSTLQCRNFYSFVRKHGFMSQSLLAGAFLCYALSGVPTSL